MSEKPDPVVQLQKEPIKSVRINPRRAQALKDLCARIAAETGVSVRESEIVHYLIDKGIPRLEISVKGLALK